VDLTEFIAPKSDQLNADDLIAHPVTVTITEVRKGSVEQPIEVHLAEFPGRPYKPSKSMGRVMVDAWKEQSSAYVGRRMTLYRDPDVMFGGKKVGGIKISHLSHIDRPRDLDLTVKRGTKVGHHVEPLPDATPAPTAADVAASTDTDELKAMWRISGPERRVQITERVAQLHRDGIS